MVGIKEDVILDGCIGVKISSLTTSQIIDIKRELTLVPSVYRGDPQPISLWAITDGHLWVPRHFPIHCECYFPEVYDESIPGSFPLPVGTDHIFRVKTGLRDERGQPQACDSMVAYLNLNGSGVLQAYTGCGKTILGFTIAAHFGKAIGVFVYNSHMLDNWVETAKLVFGYTDEDIGIVQGDRCDLGKPVTIMMVQSLYSRDDYPDELYKQMGFLLADEVNRFAAPVWQSVISMFPATYRLGMSADPTRKDGLDLVIAWNFGPVGYMVPEQKKKARPLVIQVQYSKNYNRRNYIQTWGAGRGMPDAMKYRKLLAADKGRNKTMITEMVKARRAGRKALVFTQFREHAEELNRLFMEAYSHELKDVEGSSYTTTLLMGGIKKKDLKYAMSGDFIFTTYAFSRDALNLPHIDTIFFATPCGDPLQAIGRLRDVGPEKKSLLAVDFFELNDYSERGAQYRRNKYADLGLEVKLAKRTKVR